MPNEGRAPIDIDVCSKSDSSPARNLEGALDVLISGLLAPYSFRIVEHGMSDSPESMSDRALCDFILRLALHKLETSLQRASTLIVSDRGNGAIVED